MLPKEKRVSPITSVDFAQHLKGQRGKAYFPYSSTTKEKWWECLEAILNPEKGVIVPDMRTDKSSTHVCMFINSSGENIALPLVIDEAGKITLITIKNIAESEQNPAWFYDRYEEVAKQRNMPLMNRRWRPKDGKY